ncbi:Gfo/Idh/MocA family protein [Pseudonocardia sp. CA-107938]|uniref:Gfo/Idh/MocA family protein n=1 Tax=Pseudonocardia sp. CA-107938 TaxID=3240021 RepID=UPI003D92CE2E
MSELASESSAQRGPLRVVVVGAGMMGQAWLRAVAGSSDVELAGLADLDLDAARAAAPDTEVGTDAVELAARTGAEAVIDVTTPVAHHPVTTAALFAGLPVLGEKPVAATLAEALSLAAASEVTGRLFMVSQSRRWNPQVFALRAAIAELGTVGTLTTQFFKAPRFEGFRSTMAHPLLVDMAIHAFDTARFLLGADPVAVYCETSNPPWSWYAGDAAANAVFTMAGGAGYAYSGSWCAPGDETSWNGEWRVSAEKGSAVWDGEQPPQSGGAPVEVSPGESGIEAALTAFVDAVRTGSRPSGEVHENVMSLAMVEAAVRSAHTGARVLVDDVLADAHAAALAAEQRADVRSALAAWPSPREVLGFGG